MTHKHCDLILIQIFFHFDNSENQGPTNALYKFQPNIPSGSGEKKKNCGLAIFTNSSNFYPPTESFGGYNNEPRVHLSFVHKHFRVCSITSIPFGIF